MDHRFKCKRKTKKNLGKEQEETLASRARQ